MLSVRTDITGDKLTVSESTLRIITQFENSICKATIPLSPDLILSPHGAGHFPCYNIVTSFAGCVTFMPVSLRISAADLSVLIIRAWCDIQHVSESQVDIAENTKNFTHFVREDCQR